MREGVMPRSEFVRSLGHVSGRTLDRTRVSGTTASRSRFATAAAACLLAMACLQPVLAAERLVVLSSDVGEIAVALGKAGEVVGRDRASIAPELKGATDIGSSRSLSAEPVLRLKPTLVIGTELAQPPAIYQQLESLGVKTVKLGAKADGSDYAQVIRAMGKLLDTQATAEKLASEWEEIGRAHV